VRSATRSASVRCSTASVAASPVDRSFMGTVYYPQCYHPTLYRLANDKGRQ
jgi:hypothetical protein